MSIFKGNAVAHGDHWAFLGATGRGETDRSIGREWQAVSGNSSCGVSLGIREAIPCFDYGK